MGGHATEKAPPTNSPAGFALVSLTPPQGGSEWSFSLILKELFPPLLLRLLTRGLQEILIHRALDSVKLGPFVGFRFCGVFLFFRSHVPAFQMKRFSICAKDTWRGWPDESTGAMKEGLCLL